MIRHDDPGHLVVEEFRLAATEQRPTPMKIGIPEMRGSGVSFPHQTDVEHRWSSRTAPAATLRSRRFTCESRLRALGLNVQPITKIRRRLDRLAGVAESLVETFDDPISSIEFTS
jgi:hypothetical protein